MATILIIGGARSGKSSFAQELAQRSGKQVLFVATGVAIDEEMKHRIEEHQKARPATWRTLEVSTDVGNQISKNIDEAQVVIVDCITFLVNNIFNQYSAQTNEQIDTPLIEQKVTSEISELVDCISRIDASFIIVTNEVGMGLVPANKMGRDYRDLLGRANQLLAQHADKVYFMVAGMPMKVKPP